MSTFDPDQWRMTCLCSPSVSSHGQMEEMRLQDFFHLVFSDLKSHLMGGRNHTHCTWDIWSDLHLHGIITQVSYELRNDYFDGPSPEASAHNHMEIVRHEKWKTDKNWHIHCRYRRVQRGLYQTCGELSSSQRSFIVPPHGHLFFSYSEKACKGLQEINSSPKNLKFQSPNSTGSHVCNECWSFWDKSNLYFSLSLKKKKKAVVWL